MSFDIDGTLEVGDPPGVLTMAMVKRVQQQGCWIGSCSDRPISAQRAIWARHHIAIDFAVGKLMLPDVKAQFVADVYYHIGDREDLDRRVIPEAGFAFLWPHEALCIAVPLRRQGSEQSPILGIIQKSASEFNDLETPKLESNFATEPYKVPAKLAGVISPTQ
jgi:hypothetical protein